MLLKKLFPLNESNVTSSVLQRFVADLEKAIENDNQSDFSVAVNQKSNDKDFDGADTYTFSVSVVDSKDASSGQNTSKRLNAIIDPFYRKARADGMIFTQPVGDGKARERGYSGQTAFTMTFTVGAKV